MTEQLKSCPFCGSTDVTPYETMFGEYRLNITHKDDCYLIFDGAFETEQVAIEIWNKRV